MSLYKMGAGGYAPPRRPTAQQRPQQPGGFYSAGGTNQFLPPVVINTQQDSAFWTGIKWLGAGLTLWVGYEKVKDLYDKNLGTREADGGDVATDESEEG